MGSVRMFRDRVVSMEQTQEIGEKHVDLLSALAVEALPGYALAAHGLDHERDHYWLTLTNDAAGQARRLVFTRMFLSDASRLPAVVADPNAPVRAQIVACIRDQASRPEIFVTVAGLLTEEERLERDEIEAEWRKKHEAELAARRAEEERRARERQRAKQQEEARRHAQRERERRERAAAGQRQQPQQPPGEGGGRRRRRRGRGGAGGNGGGGRPQQTQPADAAAPARPPQPASAPSADAPRAEGGGGRRRRRRGRGRGSGSSKPSTP
ncbi:MAG TPA: hypothetical protein VLJ18_03735 [Thermoanaerobaculia bacterium]|nr:hypothetical protein [Thermoanaerobaculia bacterium]